MIKLAVFGNPIKQSKSPRIHREFAKQFDLEIEYSALLSPLDSFTRKAKQFLSDVDVKGCNVTAPFKLEAHALANELSDVAKISGAVNTLTKRKDGKIIGDNTDGGGLINDIVNQHVTIKGSRILLIGAGGAARGVLLNLLDQKPSSLTIVNRTVATADNLIAICETLTHDVLLNAASFDDLYSDQFDIIINATTLSLNDQLPDIRSTLFQNTALVYDMVYKNEPTTFMQWASNYGALKVSDGLGMLVGQAALSFEIWTGLFPETTKVITMLRK